MIEINNKCVLCPPCTKANKNKLNIKYNSCQRIKDYCIDNIPVDICPEGYFADIDRICKSCKEINILNTRYNAMQSFTKSHDLDILEVTCNKLSATSFLKQ